MTPTPQEWVRRLREEAATALVQPTMRVYSPPARLFRLADRTLSLLQEHYAPEHGTNGDCGAKWGECIVCVANKIIGPPDPV